MIKLIGALMILFACGGFAFYMVASYRQRVHNLRQIIQVLEYMECELQYRMTSLPELCSGASRVCTGCIRNIFYQLSLKLSDQISPNAEACMRAAVAQYDIADILQKYLLQLGASLGRFDLRGQIQGLGSVKKCVEFELQNCSHNQDLRMRSYQTLGLCTGAALVVLFL